MSKNGWLLLAAVVALGGLAAVFTAPMLGEPKGLKEPDTAGGPPTFRRLNAVQYKRSITDIFGADIEVPGRFDPPRRQDGLLAIADGRLTVSRSGFEQNELRARAIAAQVLAEDRRQDVLDCAPPTPQAFDEACARAFIEKYGRRLYRRPLDEAEISSTLKIASDGAEERGDFYKGLELGLTRLLASPNFIFRVEATEIDPETGELRLNDFSLAARISFLLWDAPPDDALLDAAASGALRERDGLEEQINRMMGSPRFEQGVRAFFSDLFAYEQFEGLSKDQSLFPVFSSQLAMDAKEQALRTIVDLLVTNEGDYPDLFTTKKTFMNRNLGALYRVPVSDNAVEGWSLHTFSPEEPRAGLLTLAAFTMLDPNHEATTSPTNRGKAIRELLLCQGVPQAPGDVDFSSFEDPKNPNATARERLTAHQENPACAGCHAITDPIGLALENYDAIGNYRTTEKNIPIDASGTFEDEPYTDAIELGKLISDSDSLTRCASQRLYEYGVGRPYASGEREWIEYLAERFERDRFSFPSLMRTVAASDAFGAVSSDSVDITSKGGNDGQVDET